jgi:TPR repeat protein
MRCWKRAAKAGHAEGQLVYGLGLYRGIAGLHEDAQDAHMWLLRALKQVGGGGRCRHVQPVVCWVPAGCMTGLQCLLLSGCPGLDVTQH